MARLQGYTLGRQDEWFIMFVAVDRECCQHYIYIILIISLKKRIYDEYDVALICGKLPSCESCLPHNEAVFHAFMHRF